MGKKSENCKLSVIMPSLNVAPFIDDCIQSVINQSLQDIEILCIDGGSTDGTAEIIQSYSLKDNRIKLIQSGKKSHGYQCNLGISIANGKYIGFVETDDYIDLNMFEELYNTAESNELECVKSNYYFFVDVKKNERYQEVRRIFTIPDEKEIYGKMLNQYEIPIALCRDNNMWNGIYLRSFLLDRSIQLNETPGAAYQDMGFLLQTICQAGRLMYVDKAYYHYRRDNANSSIYAEDGLKKMWGEFQFCKSFFFGENGILRAFRKTYYYKISGPSITGRVGELLLRYGTLTEDARKILQEMRNELSEGVRNGDIQQDYFPFERLTEIELLFNDIDTYAKYFESLLKVRKDYHKRIVESAIQRKNAVIFGCARDGQRLNTLLFKFGVIDNVFCDNNSKLQGTRLLGNKIISPIDAAKYYSNSVFFITGRKSYYEMYKQLIDLGVSNRQIILYKSTEMEI